MSSLWNRSGTVERYADDLRASGAKAYFYLGGTTTPLTVYQDSGENAAHTHPVLADANGRWPDIFVPYIISYDVRVTSEFNVQLTFSLAIPNPDPVELTVTVGLEETVQTGMIHAELIDGIKPGYVRLNGKTIGSTASVSVNPERTNDDCLPLFTYLWNALPDTIASVSGGRGASGEADFNSNKVMTLPDWRATLPIGLDTMGQAGGGFFDSPSVVFSPGSRGIPGSRTGVNGFQLLDTHIAAHSHTASSGIETAHTHSGGTNTDGTHTHSLGGTTAAGGVHGHGASSGDAGAHSHDYFIPSAGSATAAGGGGPNMLQPTPLADTSVDGTHSHTITIADSTTHTHNLAPPATAFAAAVGSDHFHAFTTTVNSGHNHSVTVNNSAAAVKFNNLPRSALVTWYIKL